MNAQDLLYSVEDRIATITLNRPERMNALTPSLLKELHLAFDEADTDKKVKVIILTGAGTAFCAGFDQGQPADGSTRSTDPRGKTIAEFVEYWHRNNAQRSTQWTHMWRLGKPIVAAVNGWALGGGFWYQLAADITIASDRAVFAQPEIRHISNSTYLFAALCGWKNANRWALTGDHFDVPYRHGERGRAARKADRACARARYADGLSSRAFIASQQGNHDDGHTGCRASCGVAVGRCPGRARARFPQRGARAAVRNSAHARAESIS
jgi:Enoyl-CoA hydratase/isomerase